MGTYRKITHLSCVGWPAATKGATRRNLSRLDAPLIPDRDYWLAHPAYPFPRLPNRACFEHLSCCHGVSRPPPVDPDRICYSELHKVQLFTEATMKTTTMGVKLDEDVRERLKVLGNIKERTPHWLMKKAIEEYLVKEEVNEREKQEDMVRWQRYQDTGEHLSHDEVRTRLTRLADQARTKAAG